MKSNENIQSHTWIKSHFTRSIKKEEKKVSPHIKWGEKHQMILHLNYLISCNYLERKGEIAYFTRERERERERINTV